MNLENIFREADEVIKKASAQTTPSQEQTKEASVNDEVSNLAQEVIRGSFDEQPAAKTAAPQSTMTPMEKVAHSMAIVDTLLNLSNMAKLEKIAEVAKENGYTDAQVGEYIEKKASQMEFNSVAALIKDNFEGLESEKTAGIRRSLGKS